MDSFFGAEIPAVEGKGDFEPLPEGKYLAMCVEADMQQKNDEIKNVTFKFVVLEGDYKGRFIWQTYAVMHPSSKAQEYARNMIGQFAFALGEESVTTPEPLMNKPVGLSLKIDPEKVVNGNTYRARNQVRGYFDADAYGAKPAPKKAASKPAPAPKEEREEELVADVDAAPAKKAPWAKG